MSHEELIQRWDAFLQKIRQRGNEILEPARQQGLNKFIEGGNDPIPILNTFNGIRAQVQDLCKKMEDTWDEKVRDQMYDAGIREEQLDREEMKRGKLRLSLEVGFELLEMEVRNQIALYVLTLAKKDQEKAMSCTQCLAKLEVPTHLYRAEYLTCKFCETVNTYEPGTYQRMLGGMIDDIAKWNAREELQREWEIHNDLHYLRDSAFEKGKTSEKNAHRAYLEKFFAELKQWKPEIDVAESVKIEMSRL